MDQEFINQLAEKLSKLGTKRPLGFHYAHPFGTVPPDSIQCNGAEYNRTLYADFFAYATEQGWVKTETEWQEIASQNNGYCSYYSDGDGSTTFRTPKFAPFMQVAIASSNVGNYHEAGIPSVVGSTNTNNEGGVSSGATAGSRHTRNSSWSTDVSLESTVFGRSTTVQPESSEWMICVVVFGVATNVGSADVSNVMSAVARVQARVSTELDSSVPRVIDKGKSGKILWRVWSDGFIEQWFTSSDIKLSRDNSMNKTFTFPKPFSDTSYALVGAGLVIEGFGRQTVTKKATGFSTASDAANTGTSGWYACGY